TLQEYASNIVYRIMTVCDEEEVAHPTIVTESGRAMVAQSSVIIFDVLGANRVDRFRPPDELLAKSAKRDPKQEDETPRPILDLLEAYQSVSERRLLEAYHDALQARDEALSLFNVGYMSLQHRAVVDQIFWATCVRIRDKAREMQAVPEE